MLPHKHRERRTMNQKPKTPSTAEPFRLLMASPNDETEGKNKKKIRDSGGIRGKLVSNADVEVRSTDDGFLGSWHVGMVTGVRQGKRLVRYQHILSDNGSEPLYEWVTVSPVIDGILMHQQNYRGNIRPLPPPIISQLWSLPYGKCVDVFFQDAWWEGVIFDHEDGSHERKVFFPDMGDEMKAQVQNMRITQLWDEVTEEWKPRGAWLLLELIEELEQTWPLLVSVKQIWYDVRVKKDFQSIRDWTSSARDIWKHLLRQVYCENFKLTMKHVFRVFNISGNSQPEDHFSWQSSPSAAIYETLFGDSLANVPHLTNDSPPAISNLPPNQNYISGQEVATMSLKNLNEYERHRSPRETHKLQWLPAGEEIARPEYCPDAIAAYNDEMMNSGPRLDLINNVRKHLAFMKWKLEYVRDRKSLRMRYTSPSGAVYYSIRSLCRVLATDTLVPSQLDEKPQPSTGESMLFSNSQLATVESDLSHDAVVFYSLLGQDEDIKRSGTEKVNNIALKAKDYLFSIGWKMCIRLRKDKKVKVYISPSGKPFYSLRRACQWYVTNCGLSSNGVFTSGVGNSKIEGGGMHHEQLTAPSSDALLLKDNIRVDGEKVRGNSRLSRKRNHSLLQPSSALVQMNPSEDQSSFLEDIKEFQAFDKLKEDLNSEYSANVLRSDKRPRQLGPSYTYQTPRTILSWLIDANVVLPGAKVHYCCKKDGHSMKEGRITRDGIKCICCQNVFTLSKFEAHAGSKCHRPSENIFLEDGRSLLECQWQLKRGKNEESTRSGPHETKDERSHTNDYICSVCHDGGDLVLCDRCPSSFHTSCLGLKEVPDGDWFCPSCCCSICGVNRFSGSTKQLTDGSLVNCRQCERRYHIWCLKTKRLNNYADEDWFCSEGCQEIYLGLQNILGKPIPVGLDNLTWTLWKYKMAGPENEHLVQSYSKLNVALSVMHECFEPVKENHTRRDLVEDVIFSRWSDLNRLNFQGFYTVLLERDDELITVANIRVYGKKVAEMPLIATRFQYRQLGMCRILVDILEKKLMEFGVERLVLPAVPAVLDTWTNSFGFSIMSEAERLNLRSFTFLDFQGTIMCQKLLRNTCTELAQLTDIQQTFCKQIEKKDVFDCEGNSAISEVFQADQMEKEIVQQKSAGGRVVTDDNSSTASVVKNGIITQEYLFGGVNHDAVFEVNRNDVMKCYRRRRNSA